MHECPDCGRQVFCGQHLCKRGVPSAWDVLLRLEAEGKISRDMPPRDVLQLLTDALYAAAKEEETT